MNLDIQDIALEYKILDVAEEVNTEATAVGEDAEKKVEIADNEYEEQYWFRNPLIKLNHYDGESGGIGFGAVPSPYAKNPFQQQGQ